MYETRSRFGNTTPVLRCARHHGMPYEAALTYVDALVHERFVDKQFEGPFPAQSRRDLIEIANDTRRAHGKSEIAT